MKLKVKVKRVRDSAKLPHSGSVIAAGYDLSAAIDEDIIISPGCWAAVPTGIAIEPESDAVVGFVLPRSGLGAKHGVVLRNSVGVIDADYRGEIIVTLVNTGEDNFFVVHPGDRIAQLVFLPVFAAEFVEAEELSETGRGASGFGSTGVK